jgi:hypothetical protein
VYPKKNSTASSCAVGGKKPVDRRSAAPYFLAFLAAFFCLAVFAGSFLVCFFAFCDLAIFFGFEVAVQE